jgi:hypothetical protein
VELKENFGNLNDMFYKRTCTLVNDEGHRVIAKRDDGSVVIWTHKEGSFRIFLPSEWKEILNWLSEHEQK